VALMRMDLLFIDRIDPEEKEERLFRTLEGEYGIQAGSINWSDISFDIHPLQLIYKKKY
jgi:hypothetical protein